MAHSPKETQKEMVLCQRELVGEPGGFIHAIDKSPIIKSRCILCETNSIVHP